jgi:hypothetical protein
MKIGTIYKATGCRLLLLLGLFLFAGCKKGWLNQKTDTNLAVPSTLSDFQSLMDNTDIINSNSCGIGEIGSDGHSVIPLFWQYESSQEQNAYTWSHDKPNVASVDWDAAYKRVAYCNVVLEGLQGITPSNSSDRQTWNAIKGNALFQRARSFFELAQVYAPAYTSSPAGGAWGIPLRLSSDINLPTTRSTVSATYNQVITDLLAAKDLLPLTVPYKTRASKPAALALLARVYLGMEAYDQALLYADSCLQLASTLMDFNDLQFSPVGYLINKFNSEVLFHSTLVNWGNITVDAIVDSSLYTLYDSSDLRRSFFFKQGTYGITFRGSYYNGPILFSGLATDEMYLTRAECNARRGKTTAAINDMDTLLLRRMNRVNFKPFMANDSDVLAKVLQEREKELLFRGLRWSDLRRLNRYPGFALTINRVISGQTYTLAPNSFRYTFPIPDDIIQVSAIAQNPGW